MAAKVKCKTCHRRLYPSFDAASCKRADCPLDKGPKEEVLAFATFPKKKFTVLEEYNSEDKWQSQSYNGMHYDYVLQKWVPDTDVDVSGLGFGC